jgi:hypothetical protein
VTAHVNAVTVNPAQVLGWLYTADPDHPGLTRAETLGVDRDVFGYGLDGFLQTVDDLLAAQPAGLHRRADITGIELWLIPDGDVADQDALITVDLATGIRLASLHQDVKQFADHDARGTAAALQALIHIADCAGRLVADHDRITALRPPVQPGTNEGVPS